MYVGLCLYIFPIHNGVLLQVIPAGAQRYSAGTHNRESPGSNTPFIPFRSLDIFVLPDAPVHAAV